LYSSLFSQQVAYYAYGGILTQILAETGIRQAYVTPTAFGIIKHE